LESKLKSEKKKLLSLFSGCGGMDIGFEGGFIVPQSVINLNRSSDWIDKKEGINFRLKETIFKTYFANDISYEAKLAWDNYFGKSEEDSVFRVGSIVDFVKSHKEGNKNIFPENIDILTGGFPCQDFSVAGKRKGFNSHKDHNGKLIKEDIPSEETRGKLYMWMREVIQITKPKIFIAENVKGLSNLGEVKRIIQSDFANGESEEYIVLNPRVLHAGNYGIPQSRERIFFIGFKKSALTKEAIEELSKAEVNSKYSPYPTPTHSIKTELDFDNYNLVPYTKSRDVLIDLLEPNETDDYSQKYFSKAKFMGFHCQGQREVNLERLAPTIRSEHHGNIEFRRLNINNGGKYYKEIENGLEERRLTLRECARIQTFPDDFDFVIPDKVRKNKFVVSPSQAYKLVGNAVPPLLAYHIAKKIESNWNFYF
jgi:DNA (cytosine-5)-methyltransferase 1